MTSSRVRRALLPLAGALTLATSAACGSNPVLSWECDLVEPAGDFADCNPLNGPPATYPATVELTVRASEPGDEPGAETGAFIETLEASIDDASDPVCAVGAVDCAGGVLCTVAVTIAGDGTCGVRLDAETSLGRARDCEIVGWDPAVTDVDALIERTDALCFD